MMITVNVDSLHPLRFKVEKEMVTLDVGYDLQSWTIDEWRDMTGIIEAMINMLRGEFK